MKTDIFIRAIRNRQYLKFLYSLKEMMIEPYYVTRSKEGKKVIYGRLKSTNEIRKFDYDKIANIRVVEAYKFSPLIPINTFAS
jgi:hypothetical protein